MPATVKAVANKLLDIAEDEGRTIDPLQIQKLVYLAEGWTLAITGESLFREAIEAWDYGPVAPDLYHSFKMYGDRPITGRALEFDFALGRPRPAEAEFTDTEAEIIKQIWDVFGGMTGPQLISITHEPGGPWRQTRDAHPGENDVRINRGTIRQWFGERAERARRRNQDR